MGYDSRPTYEEAIQAAADSITETRKLFTIHDYAMVLIGCILADMYDLETRDVMLDLKAALNRKVEQ